jgi:hypothetical protein
MNIFASHVVGLFPFMNIFTPQVFRQLSSAKIVTSRVDGREKLHESCLQTPYIHK